jgi:hypothetical protein
MGRKREEPSPWLDVGVVAAMVTGCRRWQRGAWWWRSFPSLLRQPRSGGCVGGAYYGRWTSYRVRPDPTLYLYGAGDRGPPTLGGWAPPIDQGADRIKGGPYAPLGAYGKRST